MKNVNDFDVNNLESGLEIATQLANRYPATVWGTKSVVRLEILSEISKRTIPVANPFDVAEMKVKVYAEIRKTGKNTARPKGEPNDQGVQKYYYDLASGIWVDYTESGFECILTGENLVIFAGVLANKLKAFVPAVKTVATATDEAVLYESGDYDLLCKAMFDQTTGVISKVDISFKLINA